MVIKTQHPTQKAADRRAVIATAVNTWMHEDWTDESDLVFEVALVIAGVVTEEDEVTGMELDENHQGVTLIVNGITAIHIDLAGNIMKGNA